MRSGSAGLHSPSDAPGAELITRFARDFYGAMATIEFFGRAPKTNIPTQPKFVTVRSRDGQATYESGVKSPDGTLLDPLARLYRECGDDK